MRSLRNGLVLGAVCLGCVFTRPTTAAQFRRGDANGDGRVSVADAVKIMLYLFSHDRDGVDLQCYVAGDANDDGCVDFNDMKNILTFLNGEETQLPAPFPEPGDDPTPDTGERHCDLLYGCDFYDGQGSLDDPLAKIEILDVVAPGSNDGRAFLVVTVTNSEPIAGLSFVVRAEEDVFAGAGYARGLHESANLSYAFDRVISESSRLFVATFVPLSNLTATLPPGQSTPILEIPICLAPGTPAGAYSLTIESGELVAARSAQSILPRLVGATLFVDADVTVAEDCSAPPPPPPPPFNGTYELVGGTAPPGGTVEVALRMEADALIQGYSFCVDFDEEVLEAEKPVPVWTKPDSTEYSFAVYEINNSNATPGNGGIDEGFVLGVAVFDFVRTIGVPVNERTEMAKLKFHVRPETTANTTDLRFLDGGKGSGQPVRNAITANGTAEYNLDTAESFVLINGLVGVFPDIITFVRGDSNGDQKLDISDPQATLGYLFLGRERVACYDAADANDDGRIDVSDPVATLEYLFLGGASLPPPFPDQGEDPTEDGYGCLYSTP